MDTFLTIVHIFVCFFLIAVVLLQSGRAGGMGVLSGAATQTVFGGRGAGNFLQRVTAICAILFMMTSATLAWRSTSRRDSGLANQPSGSGRGTTGSGSGTGTGNRTNNAATSNTSTSGSAGSAGSSGAGSAGSGSAGSGSAGSGSTGSGSAGSGSAGSGSAGSGSTGSGSGSTGSGAGGTGGTAPAN